MRWLTAVICVLAVHAGGVWAIVSWPADASDETAGGFAVELAPQFSPGASEDSDGTVRSTEQEVKHTAAPTPLTAPPSPLPEPVVAAAPRHSQEPEKEPEKESVRPDETATAEPTASQEPRHDAATAPAEGFSALAAKAQTAWFEDLAKRIRRHQNYPKAAMAQRLQGLVKVQFTVDRAGRILVARVTQSSGSPVLDAEAMAMLKKAAPLPLPPPETPDASLDLELPIAFKLN